MNRLNPAEIYRYVQGHFGDRSEVWGLAAHPTGNKFVTSGDDETIRLWDAKVRPLPRLEMLSLVLQCLISRPTNPLLMDFQVRL